MEKNNSNGTKTTRSSSSSSLSGLNDELLVEILCRLGYSKYATQCKCVCKRWCSIINVNSYFLRRWREMHQKERDGDYEEELPIALLTKYKLDESLTSQHAFDYYPSIDEELPAVKSLDFLNFRNSNYNASPMHNIESIHILATYKDLVLCCPRNYDHSVYYICNPFTRQWTALPPPPAKPLDFPDFAIDVALFVSDEDNNHDILKVKVVRVLHHGSLPEKLWDNENMVKVDIFSSDDSSGEWKRWNAPQSLPFLLKEHVSYDGMLVWLSTTMDVSTYHLTKFKFHTHLDRINHDIVNYTHLPLPLGYERKGSMPMGVHKGSLRVAYMDSPPPYYRHKLIIWELNSRSQEWELVHDIDLREVKDFAIPKNRHRFQSGSVKAFHPHDRDILYLGINGLQKCPLASDCKVPYVSNIWSCNVREKTAQLIRGNLSPTWQGCDVFPLQLPSWPSFVPLLSENEKRS